MTTRELPLFPEEGDEKSKGEGLAEALRRVEELLGPEARQALEEWLEPWVEG